jgi:tetratricopeptide (TPR) repeat protein
MSGDPSHAQLMRGVQLLRLRRYGEAEAAFRGLLANEPDDGLLLHQLAVAQFNQEGKEKASLQTIERAIGCDPADADHHAFRSVILANLDRPKEALAAADEAVSLEPGSSFAFVAKASALMRLSRHAEAESAARDALRIDPDHSGAATILSHALRIQGKSAENAGQIAAMLARDPEDDDNHCAAGWQALQHGNRDEAQKHFTEALRLNAGSELAREGLLEAFKARSPLYRGYQKWVFWMASQTQARQWAVIIGFYLVFRAFRALKGTPYATLGGIGMGLYWLLVLWVHVARGVGNFLVLCDRIARHALRKRERTEAIVVGGGVVLGLALIAFAFLGRFLIPEGHGRLMMLALAPGVTLIAASFPFAHTFTNDAPVGRWVMGLAGAFVIIVGALVTADVFIESEAFSAFSSALVVPAILTAAGSTILANFRFFHR